MLNRALTITDSILAGAANFAVNTATFAWNTAYTVAYAVRYAPHRDEKARMVLANPGLGY